MRVSQGEMEVNRRTLSPVDKRTVLLHATWPLVLLCVAVYLVGVFSRDLWSPDEPRVAAIALEMSRTGNVAIPHLAGEPFVEKPPLYFAVSAASIRILGDLTGTTAAIRLTSVLWGFATWLVTFLLARQIIGRDRAVLAALILATMGGFAKNMEWIRVDIALVFFVIAAAWSFSEAYLAGRRWFLLPAGAFTAGAFLTKGAIGPVFVAIVWFSMVVPWLLRQRRERKGWQVFVFHHILCLLTFMLLAGSWVIILRVMGGQELWHKWFWDNQIGRFLGSTPAKLGHFHRRTPFYYFEPIAAGTIPWTPLVAIWIAYCCQDLWKTHTLSSSRTFLLAWSLGSILLLSLSVSKRPLYIEPIFPALAMICADQFGERLPRWCTSYLSFWVGLCAVLLVGMTFAPLLVRLVPWPGHYKALASLRKATQRNFVTGIGAAVCVYLICARNRFSLDSKMVISTAILCLGIFIVLESAADQEESVKSSIIFFTGQIPVEKRERIAAWRFSESVRGYFYYYEHWSIPQTRDDAQLLDIVAGKDSQFDSVIVLEREPNPELLEVPYRTLAVSGRLSANSHYESLRWIEGVGSQHRDSSHN